MTTPRLMPTQVNKPDGLSGVSYAARAALIVDPLAARAPWHATHAVGSAANALVLLTDTDNPGYEDGNTIRFVPQANNTGAVTMSLDGLATVAILDEAGGALSAGALVAGRLTTIVRWAGAWRLQRDVPAIDTTATPVMRLDYRQAGAGNGGTATAGAWQAYPLNNLIENTIPGASFNAGTGRFTLPAGTYEIEAEATFFQTNRAGIAIRNPATPANLALGVVVYANAGANAAVDALITLATATELQIAYAVQTTNATNGLGVGFAWPESAAAIYGACYIQKVA